MTREGEDMAGPVAARTWAALVHHPVYDRRQREVAERRHNRHVDGDFCLPGQACDLAIPYAVTRRAEHQAAIGKIG